MDVKDLLVDLGYNITDHGNYWTCQALYREGQDNSSIAIYHNNNKVIDFVTAEQFSLQQLVARTLGLKTEEEVEKFLTQKSCFVIKNEHFNPKIITCKTYDVSCLSRLVPDHSYWMQRGISENTVKQFRGGVCNLGRFVNRYVFPIIRDQFENIDIIGFSARSLNKLENKRWIHLGSKSYWVYPTFLNDSLIKEMSEVILVEGIGDLLTLWELGIKNVLCTFGLEMCKSILIYLLKAGVKNIVISFNNDAENSAGQKATEKLKLRLEKYFDTHRIKSLSPNKFKDWNDTLMKEGGSVIKEQFSSVIKHLEFNL